MDIIYEGTSLKDIRDKLTEGMYSSRIRTGYLLGNFSEEDGRVTVTGVVIPDQRSYQHDNEVISGELERITGEMSAQDLQIVGFVQYNWAFPCKDGPSIADERNKISTKLSIVMNKKDNDEGVVHKVFSGDLN